MREVNLINVSRIEVDVDDLWTGGPHDEGRLLHRVVSYGNDEIGVITGEVDVVVAGKRGRTQVQIGIAVYSSLPHLRVEEGDAHAVHGGGKAGGEARTVDACPQHNKWMPGCGDFLGGLLDCLLRGQWAE